MFSNLSKLVPTVSAAGNRSAVFFSPRATVNPAGNLYNGATENNLLSRYTAVLPNTTTSFNDKLVQRKCSHCEEKEQEIQRSAEKDFVNDPLKPVETFLPHLQTGGKQLSSKERDFFEPAMGYDFGSVRIHTNDTAARSAESIHARAYTSGDSIVFGQGQYAPGTDTGKRLMAHELTHVVQQRTGTKTIQRVPDTGTASLHEEMLDDYIAETGVSRENASPYSADYSRWLIVRSGKNATFSPPTVVKQNPLTRRKNSLSEGFTELTINGSVNTGADVGALIADMTRLIRPVATENEQVAGNRWRCRFPQQFKINTSAKITVPTTPDPNGWQENILPSRVLLPADLRKFNCNTQSEVPVTLRGTPTDQDYVRMVHSSELEHVNELETLHKRHFVPYYKFMMGLTGVGNTQAACLANLNSKIDQQDEQAATAFILADMAETRKFDAPGSTHSGTLSPTTAPNCTSITLKAQASQQQPALDPGNVRTVPPVVTPVNPANLTVSGSTLNEGTKVISSFGQPQTAQTVLAILQHYQVSSINTIGPFTFLLSGTAAPSGEIKGVNEAEINPDLYQVTVGMPAINNWVISEIRGDQYFNILDFGAARDQAYSAVAIMRAMRFTNQCWVGSANNPAFSYFRI